MDNFRIRRISDRSGHVSHALLVIAKRLSLRDGKMGLHPTKPTKYRDEFKSYAESLPANIVMNGLGQACAMLLAQAKGKSADQDAHRLLYDHLQDWIRGRDNAAVYPNDQDLVKAVINHGQGEYVRAQFESLAYLNWLKKFAQAYLAGEEN